MPKYLSGRVKRTDQAYLSTDRYQFLGLEQAEPNLADPPPGGTSPNIPVGQRAQIISVEGFPGERFWVPVEGGIIPGSLSVFEEGVLVGGISSTTQLNFKGNIITAIGNRTGLSNPGVAVTLSVDPPGTDGQLLFNKNGDFGGSSFFNYDDSTVGVASVGIGTSAPTQNLHILGNLRLENKFFDTNNSDGANGQVLVRNSSGGLEYTNVNTLSVSAGGTFNNIQFHDNSGLLDGASNFVFVESTERVGVGSTQPTVLFDVLGNSKFTGVSTFSDIRVSGILSASLDNSGVDFETDVRFEGANYNAEWDISESALEFEDNAKATFGSDSSKELEIFFDGTHSKIDHTSTTGSLFLAGDSLVLSNSGMGQYYLQAAENGSVLLNHSGTTKFQTAETGAIVTGIFTATQEIQADKITTIENNFVQIDVSGIATMTEIDSNFIDAENIDVGFATVTDKLNVSGFTTTKNIFVAGIGTFIGQLEVDSVKIDGSKVESTTGNLILESVTNTITVNDVIFVDNSDDSTSKDTGSIITQGGVGIEKGLAVGLNLIVGGATTLASNGGITTTGGDLYIGGDLFVNDDIVLDNITAGSANVTGLSTFVGLSTFNDGISVESGITTFRDNVLVSTGATVGFGDSIFIPDNKKISLGDDRELEIYYGNSPYNSGSADQHSYIRDAGTGDFVILSNEVAIRNAAETQDMARFYEGDRVELRYADSLKFETTNEGVKINGITSMTGGLKVGTFVDSNLTPSENQQFDLGQGGQSWNKLYIKEIIGTDKIAVEETTIDRLDVTGIGTIAKLNVTGLTTTKNLLVTQNSVVSGLSTFVNDSNFQSSVGIGTTLTGTYALYVKSPVSTIARFERTTDQGGGSWAKVDIKAGTSSGNSYLTFSDVDNTEIGYINYEHNNDSLIFGVNQGDRLRINSSGQVSVGSEPSSGIGTFNVKPSNADSYLKIRNAADFDGNLTGNAIDNRNSGNSASTDLIIRSKNLVFWQASTGEKLRINTDGDLLPGGANQDIGSSGNKWSGVYAENFYGDLIDVQKQFTTASLDVTGLSTFRGAVDIDASVDIRDNLVVNGNTTLGDETSDTLTVNASATFVNDNGIFIKSNSNNPTNGAQIQFSDNPNTYNQIGHIRYKHNNNQIAPNTDDGFIIGGSESPTVVKVEGRALVDEKVGINITEPQALLDIGGNTDNNVQAIFTRGSDQGFRVQAVNESSSNADGASQGKFGLFYSNGSDIVGMQFHRGGGTGAGSLSFTTGGTEKVLINKDGDLLPGSTANEQDIGSSSKIWKNVYAENFYGSLINIQTKFTTGSLDVTGLSTFRGDVDIDASVDIRDNLVVNGNVDLGSESSDSITVAGRFDSSLIPINDDSIDLGLSNRQWKDLYIDGTANIDILDVDQGANIQGGAVINTLTVEDLAENEVVFITKNSDNNDGKLEGSSKLTYNGTELFVDGDLTVTGDLSYEDVANVDALGIITARKGLRVDTGGIIVESGISTFKDKIEAQNVIQPKFGNNDSVGIQWESNPGGGSGDKAFIRYYREGNTGENTRLEIKILNDADDDIYLNAPIVTTSGNLQVNSNFQVLGNTDIGNNTGDTLSIVAKIDTDIIPSGNNLKIGNSNQEWNEIYANKFIGAVEGNADAAKQIEVSQSPVQNADHYITFINRNPDGEVEDLFADVNLTYNPNSNQLDLPKIKPESIVDATDKTGDQYQVPIADGTGNWQWGLNSDTTYDFSCVNDPVPTPGVDDEVNPRLRLSTTGDDDDVRIYGSNGITVRRNNNNELTISGQGAAGGLLLDSSVTDVLNLIDGTLSADDPNADRLIFWDESAGKLTHLSAGDGLEINGTEIKATTSAITIQDEGVALTNAAEILDFRGGGVTATGDGTKKTITVLGLTFQNEGDPLATVADTVNFTGDGVSVTGETNLKTVTITQGGGDGHVDLQQNNENSFFQICFAVSSETEDVFVNDNLRLQVRPRDGALRVMGDITAFRSSDIRLKDNISPIKNALTKVSSISGNTFTWNEKSDDDKQGNDDVGVIAQEIDTLGLPGITTTREDGTQAVMYEKLVPLLIEAIKELKGEIDELKSTK